MAFKDGVKVKDTNWAEAPTPGNVLPNSSPLKVNLTPGQGRPLGRQEVQLNIRPLHSLHYKTCQQTGTWISIGWTLWTRFCSVDGVLVWKGRAERYAPQWIERWVTPLTAARTLWIRSWAGSQGLGQRHGWLESSRDYLLPGVTELSFLSKWGF